MLISSNVRADRKFPSPLSAGTMIGFVLLAGLMLFLRVQSPDSFLSAVELLAGVMAFAIFIIAWHSRSWIGNNYLLLLGIGYACLGMIWLCLLLVPEKGWPFTVFPPLLFEGLYDRLLLALRAFGSFLIYYALSRPQARFALVKDGALVVASALIIAGLFIFAPLQFDPAVLELVKLPFEILLLLLLCVATVKLILNQRFFDPRIFGFLQGAIIAKVLGAAFVMLGGYWSDIGYIIALLSIWYVLRIMIEVGLRHPQALIFGSLERERALSRELADQAHTLKSIMDAAPEMVVLLDASGRFRYVSRAAERFVGQDAQLIIGRDVAELGSCPQLMIPLRKMCQEIQATRLPIIREILYQGDSAMCHLELQMVTARVDGQDGFLAIARDVTTHKQLETDLRSSLDNNRMLMMEVHHRVKNNLQIVSSILQMQGWQVEDAAIRAHFDEACGRIMSLAKVHEMLYKQENAARVDFVAYVEALCAEALLMYGVQEDWVRVKVNSQSLSLGLDVAVPLALIVHELLTNSLKHAFNETGGQIDLSVQAISDTHGELVMADNGQGMNPISSEAKTSLGLRMVQVLVRQIQGEMETSTDQGGTSCRIVFPLEIEGN